MKCYRCNSEVNENMKFCEKCGAPVKVKKISKRKKVTICIVAILLMVMVATFIGVNIYIGRKPSEKQTKNDLKKIVLNDYNDADISKLSIEKEVMKKNNIYDIRMRIKFSLYDVEYEQKYILTYAKDDKWKMLKYEPYNKDDWKMKPLKSPDKEEVLDSLKDELFEESCYNFTKITEDDKNEYINLDKGIATYYYDAEEESAVRNVKAKIKFEYEFDDYSGTWDYTDYELTDEDVQVNIDGTWKGKATESGTYGDDIKQKVFKLTITKVDGENVEAEIQKVKTTYKVSGNIDAESMSITLTGVDDPAIYLDGSFDCETGDFTGSFYTDYDKSAFYYFSDDSYDVTLKKQN